MTLSTRPLRSLTADEQTANVTADFDAPPYSMLGAATVSAALSVTLLVVPDTYFPAQDPAASSRMLGSAQVTASPSTGRPNAAIIQQIGNLLPGVRYAITIVGVASDGTRPTLWRYIAADYPGMPGS